MMTQRTATRISAASYLIAIAGLLLWVAVGAGSCAAGQEAVRWAQAVASALKVRARGSGQTAVAVSARHVYAAPDLRGELEVSVDGLGTVWSLDTSQHPGPWCGEVVLTLGPDQAHTWIRVEARDPTRCEAELDLSATARLRNREASATGVGLPPDGPRLLVPRSLIRR